MATADDKKTFFSSILNATGALQDLEAEYYRLAASGGLPGGSVSWDDVTGKPATFPPTIGTTATTAKAGNYAPTWAQVTGKPSTFPPTVGVTAATALAGNTPVLSPAAITAIGALTSESTLEDVIAALTA